MGLPRCDTIVDGRGPNNIEGVTKTGMRNKEQSVRFFWKEVIVQQQPGDRLDRGESGCGREKRMGTERSRPRAEEVAGCRIASAAGVILRCNGPARTNRLFDASATARKKRFGSER